MNDEIPDAPDPYLGRLMGGRYEMLERVGVGAMGMVYRARQRSIDKEVAVKVLHTHIGAQENLRKRFAQEARVGSRFQHPCSVEVLDFGVHFDGTVYLVMEYLRGRSLDDLVRASAPLPLRTVVEIMDQVLSAVAAAHDAGIVHRDLKPENVMLLPGEGDAEYRVKVADFGLAKLLDSAVDSAERARLTGTGIIHGTPGFIAPEQAQAREVDGRADLYSCGVMIFEMCTGRLPFAADSAMAMVLQHVTAMPPPPSLYRRDLDPRVDALVLRAMEKLPDARHPDARAMRTELRALLDPAPARPTEHATLASSPTMPPPTEPAVTDTRGRRWVLAGLASAAALSALVFVTQRDGTAAHPPVTSIAAPSVAAPSIAAPSVAVPSIAPSVAAPSVAAPSVVVMSPSRAVTPPVLASPSHTAIARSHGTPALAPSVATPSVVAPSSSPTTEALTPPPTPPPLPAPSVAAPAPAPPPVVAAAQPSLVRAVHGAVVASRASGGVARTAVTSRVAQAAEALTRCVEQRLRGTDALHDPATVSVVASVRDRRLDAMQARGAPVAGCDASMRSAFAGDLPPSEDLEYEITFQVELTALR